MREPDAILDNGNIKLFCGDCLEILPTLEAGSVDAVVTDPPYGIGEEYASFSDTKTNVSLLVRDVMPLLVSVGNVVLITPGNGNQHLYPVPDWTLCWVNMAGTGMNRWGFTCWQPILAYGKNPHLANRMGNRPDTYNGKNEHSEKNGHPCPKPIKFVEWLVDRATALQKKIVLDPFMGSGTTGVACVKTGRKFIGIELDRGYFDIAVKRIEKALKERDEQLIPEEETCTRT